MLPIFTDKKGVRSCVSELCSCELEEHFFFRRISIVPFTMARLSVLLFISPPYLCDIASLLHWLLLRAALCLQIIFVTPQNIRVMLSQYAQTHKMSRAAFAVLMGARKSPPSAGKKREHKGSDAGDDDEVVILDEDGESQGSAIANVRPSISIPRPIGSVDGRKKLILVRHGATQGYHLRDTGLSDEGRAQAGGLFSKHKHLFEGIEAIVCSPLTRALLTMAIGFGRQYALDLRIGLNNALTRLPGEDTAVSVDSAPSIPVYVTALAREKLGTRGDVGSDWSEFSARHPASSGGSSSTAVSVGTESSMGRRRYPPELQPLLPFLAQHFASPWWAEHHDGKKLLKGSTRKASAAVNTKVDCEADVRQSLSDSSSSLLLSSAVSHTSSSLTAKGKGTAETGDADIPRESSESLRRRVAALRDFIRALPHRTIAIVAHAHTLKELSQSSKMLGYCEVQVMTLH